MFEIESGKNNFSSYRLIKNEFFFNLFLSYSQDENLKILMIAFDLDPFLNVIVLIIWLRYKFSRYLIN